MPPMLNLKPEELDALEKREKYTITLIGSERISISLALAFGDSGFNIICANADQSKIKQWSKGNWQLADQEAETKLKILSKRGKIKITSDLKAATSGSDLIIIMVNPKIDDQKRCDSSEIEGICKQVGMMLRKSSLVVYGGISGIGFTETLVKETLENNSGLRVGEDFGLAFFAILHSKNTQLTKHSEQRILVGANDKSSLNSATLIFGSIFLSRGIRTTLDVKTAELSSLFSSVNDDTQKALANEFAVFCENAGIDYTETVKLTKPDIGEVDFAPSIFEEDNRNEAYLLLENAEAMSFKLRLPLLARQINEDIVKHVFNITQDALRDSGKSLRRSKVAILGVAEPGTAATVFLDLLKAKGAKTSLYNPRGLAGEAPDMLSLKNIDDAAEGADCVIIVSAPEFLKKLNLKKLHAVMKAPAVLIDLKGVVDPVKAAKEGFSYHGLGIGVRKK